MNFFFIPGPFLEWLFEQRSTIIGGAAIVLFAVTLVLRYGFNLWWPWGIVMSAVLGVAAIATSGND